MFERNEIENYFLLVARYTDISSWEIVFGAYDRETIKSEMISENDSWHELKIVPCNDTQESQYCVIDVENAKTFSRKELIERELVQ